MGERGACAGSWVGSLLFSFADLLSLTHVSMEMVCLVFPKECFTFAAQKTTSGLVPQRQKKTQAVPSFFVTAFVLCFVKRGTPGLWTPQLSRTFRTSFANLSQIYRTKSTINTHVYVSAFAAFAVHFCFRELSQTSIFLSRRRPRLTFI